MYPFSQAVTPAAKTHMEAQLAYFNDLSKSIFHTVQQFSDLNIQLAQTLLEEGTVTGQQVLTANRPTDVFAAAAAHAQPTAAKLRAYQQHLSRVAADTHVELAKVAEEHVTETTRTAKALADEVARVATEETENTMRDQQEAIHKFTDPFERFADAGMRHQQGNEMRGSSTLQSAGQNSAEGREGREGSLQGGMTPPSQSGKQQGARKET
ncbi:TIGR01841 family phasin [Oxalobacteraceae bacterium]|nr:TIGR01841 family phasin [Oxalobacteraceae bacterium]